MPILAYLTLRLRLLGRLLREIGGLRLALLALFGGMGLLQIGAGLARMTHGRWVVPPLVALALLGAHRQRADAQFLTTAAPDVRPWLAAEYGLLALPLALGLLAGRGAGPAALTLALALLVAWVPPARAGRPTRHRWRSPFRSEAFEWVSGMRATKGLLIWPVLLGLTAWQRAAPVAPVAALVAWLLVAMACYGTPEPVAMLALAARTPRQFLRRRLALGLGYGAATALPFGLLLGVGISWGAAVAVLLVWLALLALLMLTKYAFYPNATHIRLTQSLVVALSLAGVGQPSYPPLLLAIAAGLVWQSRRRLGAVLGNG